MGKAVQYATYMSEDNKGHAIEHAIEFEDLIAIIVNEGGDNDIVEEARRSPEMNVIRRVLLNQINSIMLCAVSNPDTLLTLVPMFVEDSNDIVGAALSLAFYLGRTSEPTEYNPFLDD